MKRRLQSLGLAVLAALLLSASCKKEKPPVKLDVDKDFRSYVHFNNGTWWVYMNVDSSEFDTCIVSESQSEYEYHEDFDDPKVQFEELWFITDDRGLQVGMLTRPQPLNADLSNILYTSKVFYMYGGILGPSNYNLFKYPYQEDTLRFAQNDDTYIKERLDSLSIQNVTYYNVITCRHEFQQAGSLIREITYAKGIGPIRKVYWDGSTWELIDYAIL